MSAVNISASIMRSEQHMYGGKFRQDWLDWLRGFAILLVLASHYQVNWGLAGIMLPFAAFNMRVGWSGVDLFFVISGFLIGNLLLKELATRQALRLRVFYARRVLKIWPLLYCIAPVYFIFFKLFGYPQSHDIIEFIPTYFHVQNYFPMPMGHLWSLAVEEHFYLGLPIFLLAFRMSPRSGWLPVALCIVVSIVILVRLFAVYELKVSPLVIRISSQYRIDALLFGVILAWVHLFKSELWIRVARRQALLFFFAVVLFWPFAFNPNHSLIVSGAGLTSIYIGYGFILTWTSLHKEVRLKSPVFITVLKVLAFTGRASFPIYLLHPFVWYVFEGLKVETLVSSGDGPIAAGGIWLVGFIAFISISVGLGSICGTLIEQPLLKIRNRFVPACS